VGLGALTRPSIVLFPLLLLVWYRGQGYGRRAAVRGFSVVALMMLAVVMPWMARNHAVSGRWELVSSGGDNFWIGNNPRALGGYVRAPELDRLLGEGETRDVSRGYRLGLAAIAAEPGKALLRCLQKVTYFFALETDGPGWNLKGFAKPWPVWLTLSVFTLVNVSYLAVLGGCVLAFVSGSGGALAIRATTIRSSRSPRSWAARPGWRICRDYGSGCDPVSGGRA